MALFRYKKLPFAKELFPSKMQRVSAALADASLFAALAVVMQAAGVMPFFMYIALSSLFCAYYIAGHGFFGTTAGKKLAGIRLSAHDGGKPGLRRAILRLLPFLIYYTVYIALGYRVYSEGVYAYGLIANERPGEKAATDALLTESNARAGAFMLYMKIADICIAAYIAVCFFQILFRKQGVPLHDRIAETVVLRVPPPEERAGSAP